MKVYQALIFDFDYTLADSSAGALECINFALGRMGLPLVPAARAHATIGLSLTETFCALVGEEHRERSAEFAPFFVERADQVMADLTQVFATVAPMVEALAQRGLALGIVSTKFRYRIEGILRREGLEEAFAVIVGGEDVTAHKPDPSGLLAALGKLQCAPERALYVGDSVVDTETARRAGVPFVAVLSGVTPAEDFSDSAALAVLDDVSFLPELLSERR